MEVDTRHYEQSNEDGGKNEAGGVKDWTGSMTGT